MSRHHNGRRRRDFNKLNKRYVANNYMKKWSLVVRDIKTNYGIQQAELEFMVYVYDFEFFTVSHVAKTMKRSREKLYERTILPLKKKGWIENVYHGKEVDQYVNALFQERRNHEHRLGLSQKGRMMVQRVYRKLDGSEPITF